MLIFQWEIHTFGWPGGCSACPGWRASCRRRPRRTRGRRRRRSQGAATQEHNIHAHTHFFGRPTLTNCRDHIPKVLRMDSAWIPHGFRMGKAAIMTDPRSAAFHQCEIHKTVFNVPVSRRSYIFSIEYVVIVRST